MPDHFYYWLGFIAFWGFILYGWLIVLAVLYYVAKDHGWIRWAR